MREQIKRTIREQRRELHLERTRANLDEIRRRCRHKFSEFVKEAWPLLEPDTPLIWSWHLDAMCDTLQAISEGRINPRLIINISPGSSKSMIVSVLWNAWVWGPLAQPGKRFVSTSFDFENVKRDTGKSLDLISSDWYRELWPEVELTKKAEANFRNTRKGGRLGVAFASLMGKRGDVLTIDDPHSLEGAESETERKNAVKRFIEGGRSRVNDRLRSAIVIVMQRVHMDDLTGAVLDKPHLGYMHLCIPMEFEPERTSIIRSGPIPPHGVNDDRPIFWQDPRTYDGELMDPVRMPRSEVEAEKETSEYVWAGQYQQRPAPREGGLFKADLVEVIDYSPGGGQLCRGWDLAGTKRKTSAWTVGLLLRRCDDGTLVIEDVKRVRADPFGVKRLAKETATNDTIRVLQSFPQDPAQAGLAQKMDWGVLLEGMNFRFSAETGDKETRALGPASAVSAGLVKMVRAPWNSAFLDEVRNFPSATYKDQVDAFSRAYTELLRNRNEGESGAPQLLAVGDVDERNMEFDPDLDWRVA